VDHRGAATSQGVAGREQIEQRTDELARVAAAARSPVFGAMESDEEVGHDEAERSA
jgi:hypothetical protein